MAMLLRDKSPDVLTGRHLARTGYLRSCAPTYYITGTERILFIVIIGQPFLIRNHITGWDRDTRLFCSTARLGFRRWHAARTPAGKPFPLVGPATLSQTGRKTC